MKRIIAVLVVAVLLAVIMQAGLGCTKPPAIAVSGSWEAAPHEITWETIPGMPDSEPAPWIGHMTGTSTFNGAFEGTSVGEYSIVLQDDWTFTAEGTASFTGNVEGKEGTFVTHSTLSGTYAGDNNTRWKSTCEIISGTGELTNLSGTYEIEAKNTWTDSWEGTYSGTLRLEG